MPSEIGQLPLLDRARHISLLMATLAHDENPEGSELHDLYRAAQRIFELAYIREKDREDET